ncbi:hypothetical protein GF366_00800, partial [Candidatus Peregrinibacteria bacterium]|nr:hypothetical protein [Candidatus Peregrinibacteria bacterium]
MVLIPTKKFIGIGKKFLCGFICFCLFFTQAGFSGAVFAAVIDPPDPPNNPEVIYDLVAIVIDTELDKDTSSYSGLNDQFPNYLNENTIGERIIRYASDIQNENDLTDVKILFFDKESENVNDLAKALENLYVNGDGTHNNRLVGAVLIGDIPMPVVNKEGNRFMSIFPYVDFYDKAYVYNSETKSYERNIESDFPKPEIWHGIIRAPESGISGMEKLAEYFDKNHLYYSDVPNYSKFDKKLFFGDLTHEEEMMNSDIYRFYIDYLNSWEDLAYMRYNKHWANELAGAALEENDISVNLESPPEYENENFDPEEFSEALENADLMNRIPDIYSKQIIDKYLLPYYKVFSRYVSEVNDFAEWTGRFAPDEKGLNVDSIPTLITIKDEYTKYYLRAVADSLENKINEVIEKIEESLPIITESQLSGSFDYEGGLVSPFKISTGPGSVDNSTSIKYHYEEDGEFFIKGINADVIETAKRCGVYLGSTKTDYFDENLNYNPKSVGGEYSVLTRAIRSDDPETAFAVPSIGINTRLLSPTEANILTGFNAGNGALIEDNNKYGIPAFIGNTLYGGNFNPVEEILMEGIESYTPIVITKVNGNSINAEYTFDQAINESYETVVDVIRKINNDNLENLDYSGYNIAVKPGENLDQENVSKAVGNFDIEYYRNGQNFRKNFTFTVREDDGNYYIVRDDAEGDPEIIVLLSRTGYPGNFNDFGPDLFDEESDGAIFPLYDTENQGYDISAGCNMNSANKNSDRCFYWMATMPVLDPAGSSALSRVSIPGGETQLLFPENVEKDDFNQNSNIPAVYAEHKNILQFPGGETGDYYQYEDVDEVVYNSCFMGLPEETYNDLLTSMNNFISNNGDEVEGSPGKSAVWQNIDDLTAEDIILNNTEDLLGNVETVNLKHFSDRYGIFDGIDNDGDGIRDYEWRDIDEDGVYETKWFDFDESSSVYGIPDWNLEEISRKMLSHNSSYTIPAVLP